MFNGRIITVGVSPAWDVKCTCESVKWGEHVKIDQKTVTAAGKALNVSRALAWMKTPSVACGLWGSDDYHQMKAQLQPLAEYIDVQMTRAEGSTRQNIWILDRYQSRDIHLRDSNDFINSDSLASLEKDLMRIVGKDDVVAFAGSMPVGAVAMAEKFCSKGIKAVIDTSGEALEKVKALKGLFAVKPNIDELRELTGGNVEDNLESIIGHGSQLLANIENILVTRGGKGAIAITKSGCWSAYLEDAGLNTAGTVGCGDYFLAGFLAGLKKYNDYAKALETAVISGSGRAFAMDTQDFSAAAAKLKVKIERL